MIYLDGIVRRFCIWKKWVGNEAASGCFYIGWIELNVVGLKRKEKKTRRNKRKEILPW